MVDVSGPAALALRVAVVAGALLALVVVARLDGARRQWGRRLRSRLLLGVPWGTLVVVALVSFVYFVVQGGHNSPRSVLALPFYSWSYFYPLGMVLAPFSHAGLGHVTGNLIATATLAPLAEYAFSHFPTQRGESSFDGRWRNPYVRAFVVFPLAVIAVGLCTSLLAWGPLIGFSGVVFAFAGYALVHYPLGTVVALSARDTVSTVYYSLQDPVVTGTASSSFSVPWWADIAVQGHLLGLLLGASLGVLTLRRRDGGPSALRLWVGATVAASSLSLWALWWYDGADAYVLFRGPGLLLVLGVGLLLAAALRAPDRSVRGVNLRTVGTLLLILPLLTMGFVAVPLNLTTVDDTGIGAEQSVTVDGYTVGYADGVVNPKSSVFDFSALGVSTAYETSGVVVVSERRQLWSRAISPGALASSGRRSVLLGSPGNEKRVTARRTGWNVNGAGTAYRVLLRAPDGPWTQVHQSGPQRADLRIQNRSITFTVEHGAFHLHVSGPNGTPTAIGEVPEPEENVTIGGLQFERVRSALVARTDNGTAVPVARKEN